MTNENNEKDVSNVQIGTPHKLAVQFQCKFKQQQPHNRSDAYYKNSYNRIEMTEDSGNTPVFQSH